MTRLIAPGEEFAGDLVTLRLATIEDCTPRYVGWLNDPTVSQFLETRWAPQTLESIRSFVASMLGSSDSYLFCILEGASHIGNIKLGPINVRHAYADVSYFIGERTAWGKGYATDAIRVAARVGFERLALHRVQAGLYASNIGSARALEKAGFIREGSLRQQLRRGEAWEDHVWYGLLRT